MSSFWPLFAFFLAMDLWFAYDGWLSPNPDVAVHARFNQMMAGVLAVPAVLAGLHTFAGRLEPSADEGEPVRSAEEAGDRWSWGAAGLAPFWALGNRVYWGLLALIPVVGIALAIYLGFRGERFARRSFPWKSENEFLRAQKIWGRWGIVALLLQIPATLITVVNETAAG